SRRAHFLAMWYASAGIAPIAVASESMNRRLATCMASSMSVSNVRLVAYFANRVARVGAAMDVPSGTGRTVGTVLRMRRASGGPPGRVGQVGVVGVAIPTDRLRQGVGERRGGRPAERVGGRLGPGHGGRPPVEHIPDRARHLAGRHLPPTTERDGGCRRFTP